MFFRFKSSLLALVLTLSTAIAQENFVGDFAEPIDGGNLDTARSTFNGETVVIVPGLLATAATLATAHYFVGSRSTGTSSGANGADALAEAEGTGTSIGARGME